MLVLYEAEHRREPRVSSHGYDACLTIQQPSLLDRRTGGAWLEAVSSNYADVPLRTDGLQTREILLRLVPKVHATPGGKKLCDKVLLTNGACLNLPKNVLGHLPLATTDQKRHQTIKDRDSLEACRIQCTMLQIMIALQLSSSHLCRTHLGDQHVPMYDELTATIKLDCGERVSSDIISIPCCWSTVVCDSSKAARLALRNR